MAIFGEMYLNHSAHLYKLRVILQSLIYKIKANEAFVIIQLM